MKLLSSTPCFRCAALASLSEGKGHTFESCRVRYEINSLTTSGSRCCGPWLPSSSRMLPSFRRASPVRTLRPAAEPYTLRVRDELVQSSPCALFGWV